MDRLTELEITRRSVVMVSPGQLAMRRETAIKILEELITALEQIEAVRRAVDPESAALSPHTTPDRPARTTPRSGP